MADPQIVVRATGDFRRLYGEASRAESRFGKLGAGIKAGLVGAAVAGTAALVKLGTGAVKAASDSQQSLGATESVFGKYADTVIKRSNQAAEAIGLSANEYRELSNVTGAMLSSAGTPLRKVTDLTDQLNRRAADMAATFGGTTRDAVESISALLRGETDPIEKYGVAIKQSDINARLAAKGLDDLTGSALKQAEQQARLELLFKQTAKTQGQFARESDTLAGASQRLGAKVDDLESKFGELLLPVLTQAATWAGDELVPALEDLQGWLEQNSDEFASLGGAIRDGALPPLQFLGDAAEKVFGFLAELPPPVRELAIQAGIAAVALPKFKAALDALNLTELIGNLGDAETRTIRLADAARTAAGVAGMVALAQGVSAADREIGLLATTAGGALTGFAVGGPWGLAIGAGAGALLGLATNTRDSNKAFEEAQAPLTDYRATLDEVTGAITRQTRVQAAKVLQEKGALELAKGLGISTRDLVSASLGQEAATARVNKVFLDQLNSMTLTTDAYGNVVQKTGVMSDEAYKLAGILGIETDALIESQQKTRDLAVASGQLAQALKGVQGRSRIVSRIETQGWPKAEKDVARLTRGLRLTPKQIRTVMNVLGVDGEWKKVRRLKGELEETGRKRPTPRVKVEDRQARQSAASLDKLLAGITGKDRRARLGLDDKKARNGVTSLENLLGGVVRKDRKAKVNVPVPNDDIRGINNALNQIPDETVIVWVERRNRGGGRNGQTTSSTPLRTTISEQLARTSVVDSQQLAKAGRSILDKILRGVTGGGNSIRDALRKITAQVEKQVKLKDPKKERRRERAILRGLSDEYRALRKNGREQDRINRQLQRRQQHLEKVRAYVEQIRESFLATGDITQLGRLEDGTVASGTMLDQLRQQVSQAKRFAELIRQLTDDVGPKLNKTSLAQLLQAGPEAGLATAEALAQGGEAAVEEINSLTAELSKVGGDLGSQMSDEFYKVGLNASIGLVKGLEKDQRALDRAARRLARRLARQVRRVLGIRSPSKEFQKIGLETVRGLSIGLDDTHVRQDGRRLAQSLVKGFSTPQLDASLHGAGRAAAARVEVKLTAEQLSAVQRGKAVQMDIDAGRVAGVRRMAVTTL